MYFKLTIVVELVRIEYELVFMDEK